jgi:polynucleotide 5'-kinase involved in rRNA processing
MTTTAISPIRTIRLQDLTKTINKRIIGSVRVQDNKILGVCIYGNKAKQTKQEREGKLKKFDASLMKVFGIKMEQLPETCIIEED